MLLQILLPFIAFPGFLISPESPRWLVSVGHMVAATEVLVKHHAGGDQQDALVHTQMVEIETAITAEKEASATVSYLDLMRTKGNRHRLFISVTLGFIA